jgi:hypothetical protein
MLTKEELKLFNKLNTPQKIQDFLNDLGPNHAQDPVCMSPRLVLQKKKGHCLEGALLATAILWHHGHKPLLLDLVTTKDDHDHVVALFQKNGHWGAISKTRHAVLRYREPIYKTIRELAMSYFHEYFLDSGVKTMRSYSKPFSLAKYGKDWITSEDDLYEMGSDLDDAPHVHILTPAMIKGLRKADTIEIQAGKIIDKKKL